MSALFSPQFLTLAIEVALKSCLILSVALMLTWFMRRSSAATRHLVLSAAVLAILTLPLVSVLLPSWNLTAAPNPFASVQERSGSRFEHSAVADEANRSSLFESEAGSPGTAESVSANLATMKWFTWITLAWLVGGVLLLIRLVGGRAYAYWIGTIASPAKDDGLIAAANMIAKDMKILRAVEVVESDRVAVPIVSGLFRSRVIMPSKAHGWSKDRLEAILHHEFAHIKRKDTLVQFFAQIACCLYWVNPLTWILERRLFIERERACDDIAMGRRIKPSEYAGHLMEVMEEVGAKQKLVWVTSAMAEGTDFKDRILSVLDPLAKRSGPNLGQWAAVVALATCLLIPLAAIHPWAEAGAEVQLHVFPSLTINGGPTGESFAGDLDEEQKLEPEDVVDHGTQALIAVLQSDDARMREHAATALAKQGAKSAVPALMSVVRQDPDPDVREHAASALAVLGDARAIPALTEALTAHDARVREHVASALGKLKDTRAVASLVAVLRSDTNARVREHAASAIGTIGGSEASRALTQSYHQDTNIRVRAHAAYGLGLARDAGAVDLLIDGLSSGHAIIRSHCAEALGLIGVPQAVEPLKAALDDPDSSVRQSAKRALDSMTW